MRFVKLVLRSAGLTLAVLVPWAAPSMGMQNCVDGSGGACNVTMTQAHDANFRTLTYTMTNNNAVLNVCFSVSIDVGVEFARKNLEDETTVKNVIQRVKTTEVTLSSIKCGPANDCTPTECAIQLTRPKTYNVSTNAASELSATDGSLDLVFESEVVGSQIVYIVTNLAGSSRTVTWEGTPINSMSVPGGGGSISMSVSGSVGRMALRQVWIDGGDVLCGATTHLPSIGTPVCFGDGSGSACPCGNDGGPGAGCANGTGAGGLLSAAGDASVSNDSMSLTANDVINNNGLFFQGSNTIGGGLGSVFGDGIRCCGGGVVRIQVVNPPGTTSPATAQMTETATMSGPPGTITAGSKKCYQYWYRDPATSPCGAQFNLTNAVSIIWTP